MIKILWIVNDKYVNNFITVYKECKKNPDFEMVVMAVEHLEYDFVEGISSEEVYRFLKSYNIDCINSYNRETDEYVKISDISPDYVFTTTPYDIYLPEPYRSSEIIKYSKLCGIEYGAVMATWEGDYDFLNQSEYLRNADYFFSSNDAAERYKNKNFTIGYLKLDEYLYYNRKPSEKFWNDKDSYKIIWKPRWTMIEGDSTLYPYLSEFYDFLYRHPDVEFCVFLHTMLRKKLESVGMLDYYNSNIEKLTSLKNFHICDDSDFLDVILSADILIADQSSTIAEFTITGKPIIYTSKGIKLNDLGNKIIENCYVADNFEEIVSTVDNLISDIDPMKANREAAKNSYFYIPENNMSVALKLLDFLKKDSMNSDMFKNHLFNIQKVYKSVLKSMDENSVILNNEIIDLKNKIIAVETENNTLTEKNLILKQAIEANAATIEKYSRVSAKIPGFVKKICNIIINKHK